MKSLQNSDRRKIISLFLHQKTLRFSDIEKNMGLRSNHVAYHIEALVQDGILQKENESYLLTDYGESLLPRIKQLSGKEQGPLAIVVAAPLHEGKICLLKRKKRPYQGYWGCPGGKIKLAESIAETAVREVREETGLGCSFESIRAVVHERVWEEGIFKHAFIIYFCTLHCLSHKLSSSDEGDLAWFDLENLPADLIPSDRLILERYLESDGTIVNVVLEQQNEKLINIRFDD